MNVYADKSDCESDFGRCLQSFRADRPSEWMMDDFIRQADELSKRLAQAEGHMYDMWLQDDGQAWSEAERYMEMYRPDLIVKGNELGKL